MLHTAIHLCEKHASMNSQRGSEVNVASMTDEYKCRFFCVIVSALVGVALQVVVVSNGLGNPNGTTYTGFIKVQIELKRPITVETSGSHERNNNTETAFYTPKGSANILHISSIHTVREVIEALLRKFTVVDNPAKFALYKKRQKDDQVYTCKLSDGEHPLLLRLLAGPDTNVLSFVLREQQTGEVMWDSFSVPELQNFIQILNREEEEHLQLLKRRYATYRQKLEEALQGQRTPG
ncbi:RASF3 protein, partial [Polypterus senegalus]